MLPIFADFFKFSGRRFLVIGDRLSGWVDVFGTQPNSNISGAAALIRALRTYFATFGVPEEISTDGGPEFTAFVTKSFFQTWGVQHRVSSAHFPQSNGWAEVAVKATKRLLMTNVSPNGDLDNDSFLHALLQLRNTPDPQCNLSRAEIVFGHPLRDAFSFVNRHVTFTNRHIRRTWREAWQAKEDALRLSAGRNDAAQLLAQHTRSLSVLHCGDRVFIQNQRGHYPRKWDKIGTIVEVLPWDQYVIKVAGSGRITKRNRRFLKVASGGMGNNASPSSVRLAPATPLELLPCHPRLVILITPLVLFPSYLLFRLVRINLHPPITFDHS